ncbi:MAG: DUF2336 domain-containing protein [Bauldia sp.]
MVVQQFLRWIETAPEGRRAEAAFALGRAYLLCDPDEEVRGGMEAAITVLLDCDSPDVRFGLADALSDSPLAPRHVILTLAADQPRVAAAVLARSPLLIDAELVDTIAAASEPLQIAVASRPVLSSTVSAAIAEVGERNVCLALVDNPGATIARISFKRIAERLGEDAEVREALFARGDLSADVHQMLVRHVGDLLGNLIVMKAWVNEARAKAVTREACDRATVAIAAETETEELAALVEHLRITGQLTTALILRAVCAGNIDFFEAALAALAGVPVRRVASLVRAGRMRVLRAVYAKACLPPLAFDAFAAALDTWRRIAEQVDGPKDRYRFTRQVVDAVIAKYADMTDGEANDLAAMLRRFAADQARDAARDFALEPSAA